MHQTRFWLAALIIAVVIIGGFVLSVPRAKDGPHVASTDSVATSTPAQVKLHDAYKKGVHTLSGTLTVPNACTSVSASATTTGQVASTTQVLLSLVAPPDTGTCLQVPQDVEFKTTLVAPVNIEMRVEVNGVLASTTQS